jgi:hypothetical protein
VSGTGCNVPPSALFRVLFEAWADHTLPPGSSHHIAERHGLALDVEVIQTCHYILYGESRLK